MEEIVSNLINKANEKTIDVALSTFKDRIKEAIKDEEKYASCVMNEIKEVIGEL